MSLEEVKGELSETLRKLKAPLLVVMDDVDRLTPSEVQELFQLIKANADFPNVVYLALFERSIIEKDIENVLAAIRTGASTRTGVGARSWRCW